MGIRDVFKKVTMEMLVLALLSESDLYGNQFPHRLVDEGYVSCTRVPSGKRRILVYYHLEASGAKRLQEMIYEYRIFADSVQQFLSSCNSTSKEVQDNE